VLVRARNLEGKEQVTNALDIIAAYAASRPPGKPPSRKEIPLWTKWAALLLKASRPQDAEKVAREILASEPGSPSAHFLLADAYTTLGSHREAVRVYQNLAPTDLLKTLSIYAKTALDAGHMREAASIAAAALIRDPWLDEAYIVLGRALARMDRVREAESFLERYRTFIPFREALEVILKLELDGKGARAAEKKAQAEFERGRVYESMMAYNQAISKNPGCGNCYLALAELSLFLERPRDAIQALKKIPSHPSVAKILGKAYEAEGDFAAARESFAAALEGDPEDAEVQERLDQLNTRDPSDGDASTADPLEAIRKAVRQRIRDKPLSNCVNELVYLADSYRASGQVDRGRRLMLFLLRLQPEQPALHEKMAMHFDELGDLFVRLWAVSGGSRLGLPENSRNELTATGIDPALVEQALEGKAIITLDELHD
jgi:tetratricopeptide (TPR) repeat protein